jgi:hypothetical protein
MRTPARMAAFAAVLGVTFGAAALAGGARTPCATRTTGATAAAAMTSRRRPGRARSTRPRRSPWPTTAPPSALGASLTVPGSRANHGLRSLALGSVSRHIAHVGRMPTLVIPKGSRIPVVQTARAMAPNVGLSGAWERKATRPPSSGRLAS